MRQKWFDWFIVSIVFKKQFPAIEFERSLVSLTKRVVLINSFWGFDKHQLMPPNLVMTGPLVKHASELQVTLEMKDPKLKAWMDNAHSQGLKIVYLSLGSMCGYRKWVVDALFYGCKKIGVKVIWSINVRS
jgi:UDP:flavonoid glycosyltransferase YjiC (YdhE family)